LVLSQTVLNFGMSKSVFASAFYLGQSFVSIILVFYIALLRD